MIKPLFFGTIKKGKVVLQDINKYRVYISRFEGKEIQLSVDTIKKLRSDNQNSYYWAVIIKILSDELGYTPEETHEALKFQFLKIHDNKKLVRVKSTTSLNTVETEEYYTEIREWASLELGCYIPLPNEVIAE